MEGAVDRQAVRRADIPLQLHPGFGELKRWMQHSARSGAVLSPIFLFLFLFFTIVSFSLLPPEWLIEYLFIKHSECLRELKDESHHNFMFSKNFHIVHSWQSLVKCRLRGQATISGLSKRSFTYLLTLLHEKMSACKSDFPKFSC